MRRRAALVEDLSDKLLQSPFRKMAQRDTFCGTRISTQAVGRHLHSGRSRGDSKGVYKFSFRSSSRGGKLADCWLALASECLVWLSQHRPTQDFTFELFNGKKRGRNFT